MRLSLELLNVMSGWRRLRPVHVRSLTMRRRLKITRRYTSNSESGRVGDAVARAANYFYQRQDYQRAIDVFEGVIANHPDANYLDVIYFNYGRCLYRTERKKWLASSSTCLCLSFRRANWPREAKRISDALVKAGF